MHLAFIFGRTPQLSRQELESVATILPFQWSLHSVQPNIVRLNPEGDYSQVSILKNGVQSEELLKVVDRTGYLQEWLGGTLKIVWLEEAVTRDGIADSALRLISALQKDTEGKRTIGISTYDKSVSPFRLGMEIKKKLRTEGGAVRIVLRTEGQELSSAQILHNKLTLAEGDAANLELNVLHEGEKYWIGVTLTSQDIEAYTKRDFGIPKPDPVSGMLPPKLAKAMINLAARAEHVAVYDPFCGNGRVLIEAAAVGMQVYGSDIEPKKIEAAKENLEWLDDQQSSSAMSAECWVGDATLPTAPALLRHTCPSDFVIVCEPYLGKPLRVPLKPEEKEAWLADLIPLYEAFLTVWSEVPSPDRPKRMIIVFPRVKVADATEASVYDVLVDSIARLGYDSKRRFTYDRPDSLIRRDLIFIEYRIDK